MPPHLPAEIWIHITSFLHTHEVRTMLGVNRTLFQIAMERKYHSVTVDVKSLEHHKSYILCLKHLKSPIVVSYVREVKFEYDGDFQPQVSNRPPPMSGLTTTGKMKYAKDVLSRFKGVSSLRIFADDNIYESLSFSLPLISYAIECYALTLTRLRIGEVNLDVGLSFLSSSPHIPQLSELHITLPPRVSSPTLIHKTSTGMYDTIACFIDRHRTSLQVIMLRPFSESWSINDHSDLTIDLAAVFGRVRHLQLLESVYIQPTKTIDQQILRRFLEQHSGTLRKITIFIPHVFESEALGREFSLSFYTPLYHLQNLGFNSGGLGLSNTVPLDFVVRFSTTLVSLKLHRTLSHDDWTLICSTQWQKLQCLEIILFTAAPETFDPIESTFPSLLFLDLLILLDQNPSNDAIFLESMSERRYTNSKLYQLNINMPSFPFDSVYAIICAFPSLVIVDDMYKETYMIQRAGCASLQ